MNAIPEHGAFVPAVAERADARFDLAAPTRLLDRFFKGRGIRLVNLSSGGFSAEGAGNLRRGDVVWISLPGLGQVRAQVRWRVEDRFGAAFLAQDSLRVRFLNGLPDRS